MISGWPRAEEKYADALSAGLMEALIDIVGTIRNIRAFWNIPHTAEITVLFDVDGPGGEDLIAGNIRYIEKIAKCKVVKYGRGIKRPEESVAALAGSVRIFVPLSGSVDIAGEKKRVAKKIDDIETYLITIEKKLGNKAFLKNAPPDVVEKEQEKKKKYEEQLKTLKDNLSALK
jgi:valyl-tRNA synthetase